MSFGNRLKARRELLKMSGEALGLRLTPTVSKQTVAHWEKGRYRPNVDQVEQLCRILRMSADSLVIGAGGQNSPGALDLADFYDQLSAEDQGRIGRMIKAAIAQPSDASKSGKTLSDMQEDDRRRNESRESASKKGAA